MIDSRRRFSKTAYLYNTFRPAYPEELADWIIAVAEQGDRFELADIGCGTGISTRLFSRRGIKSVGVEPNSEMLSVAKALSGSCRYSLGDSTNTGLPSGSVNVIVSGQAMHWFDLDPTIQEFRRILKPAGWCFAFWNVRRRTKLLQAYNRLIREYSRDFRTIRRSAQVTEEIRRRSDVRSFVEQKFFYSQKLDFQGFIGRAQSSSYVAHGLRSKTRFGSELEALFREHQQNGHIRFDYRTVAIGWQLSVNT